MTERNPPVLETAAYAEMRRAQTDAQHARENALARSQLVRQLPR
jgi:hypothetical protein